MENQDTGNDTKPKKLNKVSLSLLIILLLFLAYLLTSYVREQREAKIAQQLVDAEALIYQGKFSDAIQILNEVVTADPNRLKAYELRSMAYGNSRSNNYSDQQSYFVNSLHDIDKMIELQPGNGNNYVNRNLILRELANMAPDSASEFAIYEIANDNAEKAIAIGVSPDYSYVYRHHARNLIESNHCEEGLKETQNIVKQVPQNDPNMDTYRIYLTEAYICLGDLNKALEVAQQIQCDDPVRMCRSGFLAEIYYQMGDYHRSLYVLNSMLYSNPVGGGWRYFMRADIYYETNKEDLALQDLATGDNYTWYSNGVYWYVKSKMAFDDGDEQNGLLYLQYAESTLNIHYTPLRQQILKELEERGGSPLVVSPQIPLATTPIP